MTKLLKTRRDSPQAKENRGIAEGCRSFEMFVRNSIDNKKDALSSN